MILFFFLLWFLFYLFLLAHILLAQIYFLFSLFFFRPSPLVGKNSGGKVWHLKDFKGVGEREDAMVYTAGRTIFGRIFSFFFSFSSSSSSCFFVRIIKTTHTHGQEHEGSLHHN